MKKRYIIYATLILIIIFLMLKKIGFFDIKTTYINDIKVERPDYFYIDELQINYEDFLNSSCGIDIGCTKKIEITPPTNNVASSVNIRFLTYNKKALAVSIDFYSNKYLKVLQTKLNTYDGIKGKCHLKEIDCNLDRSSCYGYELFFDDYITALVLSTSEDIAQKAINDICF